MIVVQENFLDLIFHRGLRRPIEMGVYLDIKGKPYPWRGKIYIFFSEISYLKVKKKCISVHD